MTGIITKFAATVALTLIPALAAQAQGRGNSPADRAAGAFDQFRRATEFRVDNHSTIRPSTNGLEFERRNRDSQFNVEVGRVRPDGIQNRQTEGFYGVRFGSRF